MRISVWSLVEGDDDEVVMRTDAIRRPERRELLGVAERRLAFDCEHEHAPWRLRRDQCFKLLKAIEETGVNGGAFLSPRRRS